jgi:hypothetical protein
MVDANASLVYGFSTHEMLREVLPYIDRPLGGCASVLVEDRCMAASRQVRTHLGNTSAATSLLCSGRSVGTGLTRLASLERRARRGAAASAGTETSTCRQMLLS